MAEFQAEKKAQNERVMRAHVPINWRDVRFDNSDPDIHPTAFLTCRNYAFNFSAYGNSMIIHSNILGSGKTHLQACIGNYVLREKHIDVRFVKAFEILLEVKGTFDHGSKEGEEDVLRRLLSPTLLLIDDLGVAPPTDWSDQMHWLVFDRRLENHLPVVVTTNYFPDDDGLGKRIGNGALSRLLGMCEGNIIEFKGSDLRRKKTQTPQ